jgi:hypothetical protein
VSAAQEIEAAILKRLASIGQANVARTCGLSETTVSRWKDGDIRKVATTLAALGLKAVPRDVKCFQPEYIDALQMLARKALDQEAPQQLEW